MPPKSVEPPWYGPVCPVVWEGWGREAPPYPDCVAGPWTAGFCLVSPAHGRPALVFSAGSDETDQATAE